VAVESCTVIATFVVTIALASVTPNITARPAWLRWILARNMRSVILVIGSVLIGRALLLPFVGIPEPRVDDEYSYLLMADTFVHHRLTNPVPPSWQHFETFHVNLTPTYHSKYPVSQGLVLAFGEMVFHQPWVGVYLSTAVACGAICWALEAFVPPGWALLGGLLAAVRIGLLSYWMNSYWGGSVAALAGAVAIGVVVRLFDGNRPDRQRLFLACGFITALVVLATSRPYEGLAYSIPLVGFFVYHGWRAAQRGELKLRFIVLPTALVGTVGAVLIGYYNYQTTGSVLVMPYVLNERTYSSLPLVMGQSANPTLKFRDPIFQKFYTVMALDYGYEEKRTLSGIASVESKRLFTNWFFFVGPALSLPLLIGLFSSVRRRRFRIAVFATMSIGIALALCVYNMPHYFAPATVLVYLFSMEGLRYLWDQHYKSERVFVAAVCLTIVVVSLSRQTGASAWNVKFALPNVRKLVTEQLQSQPGRQLVLVSYDLERHYPGNELVHNWAELNSEQIIWARSKGTEADKVLCSTYSDRTFWSVETDDRNTSLKRIDTCR
jgi:hypothetical protein